VSTERGDGTDADGETNPASSFYAVESASEEISRRRAWWRTASAVSREVFLGWWGGWPETPKLRTTITIVRTSDGSIVDSYDYDSPVEAAPHLRLLSDRLESMTRAEFESAAGIGS